jgi:tetratricopeptide (TPR) repeat protein
MPINNPFMARKQGGSVTAGTRIRKARVQRGLTQAELAGDEYSAAYVSIIESGKREPSERVLKAFAKTLGITYEELATGRRPDAEATLEEELAVARRELSSGHHQDAIAAFRRIGRRAAQYELDALRDKAAVAEAFAHEAEGNIAGALTMYEELQETLPDHRPAIKADAVAGRARCVRMLGDVPYSIYVLESYLAHLHRLRLLEPVALIRIHVSLVGAYFDGGMANKAAEAADAALQLSPRIADAERLAGMHINIARVLMEKGEFEAAADSFASAESLYKELGFDAEIGRAHLARSFLMKQQARYTEARADLEQALAIFERTRNEVNQVRAMSELGGLERLLGRPDEAVFTLERAARMAGKKNPTSAAVSYRELALCHVELGQPVKAKTSFNKAIGLLEGSGDKYELAITYRTWGDALRDAKDYQKACDAYRSAAVALEAA